MTTPETPIRSNLEFWKQMQDEGYFDAHPHYQGHKEQNMAEIGMVESFRPLTPDMTMAVIGCGYGRESVAFAQRVKHVYGIDVNDVILDKAVAYVRNAGISNFTPVLADRYKDDLPSDLDLVFSIVVMQHLTKDLVIDYFENLASKLKPGGGFVVQFFEDLLPGNKQTDAALELYEPSVSWTIEELNDLCLRAGLETVEIRTTPVSPIAVWHLVHFRRPAEP